MSGEFEKDLFLTSEPETIDANRIQRILDMKYSKADLDALVKEIKGITPKQRIKILTVLNKFEHLFDGTLGEWKTARVELESRAVVIS